MFYSIIVGVKNTVLVGALCFIYIHRKKCWEEEMSAAKCPCHELTLTDTDTQNINCSEPSMKRPCYKSDTTYRFMNISLLFTY